jgi:hypothetical protein
MQIDKNELFKAMELHKKKRGKNKPFNIADYFSPDDYSKDNPTMHKNYIEENDDYEF